MRKILIHSNNTSFNRPELFRINEQYVFEYDIEMDVDAFLDGLLTGDSLGRIIKDADLLFIKVSLSENYLEYLGIRLAYHIRLTKTLGEKSRIPIVFISEESIQFLGITCNEPSILFTSGIYLLKESIEDYNNVLKWFNNGLLKPLHDFEEFINKTRIEPPSNYQSHHSIANEWALFRYHSMFVKDPQDSRYQKLGEKILQLDYLKTLHFKYMEAKALRQGFNHKKSIQLYTPTIKNVTGKYIGIIDDDSSMGWNEMYDYLLHRSGANSVSFLDFHRYESRSILVDRVKDWVYSHVFSSAPIDIFIIDLRLHDDDFNELDFDNLSGIEVLRYIKKINPGIQIVVSTASNKVWNFKRCIELGVSHFTVKESPETYNSREETKTSLRHLSEQLADSSDRSFLASMYRSIDHLKSNHVFDKIDDEKAKEFAGNVFGKNGFLDKIFGLLLLDSKSDSVLNQCLLLAFQVLEKYCELSLVGSFSPITKKWGTSGTVWLKSKEGKDVFKSTEEGLLTIIELKYIRYDEKDEDSPLTPLSFDVFDSMKRFENERLKLDSSFLMKMISVLHFREGLPKADIEKLLRFRYYRSNVAAHHTGKIRDDCSKIDVGFIVFFIDIYNKIFISELNR